MQYYHKYYRGRKVDRHHERREKRDRATDGNCRRNKLQSDRKNLSPTIPPELDICSASFDPAKALACRSLPLLYPNAKTYNNVSEYYSRTFLKGKNAESKSAKSQVFVLKRNYDWFYSTIGLSHYEGERIRERLKLRRKQRRVNFGKCKVDKLKNAVEISPESLEPLQSEKVIVKDTSGSSYLYLLKDGSAKRAPLKFRNSCSSSIGVTSADSFPTRPCRRTVYHYSPNIRRVLLTLKYREHIHTLYSLRQKAKSVWLQKNNVKAVLSDAENTSSEVETEVKSTDPDDLHVSALHSPADSGIISSFDYSEDTDETCDEDVKSSIPGKSAGVFQQCETERENQLAVLLEKETFHVIENIFDVNKLEPERKDKKLHLEVHSGEMKEKSPVHDLKDSIQTQHNKEVKVHYDEKRPDHNSIKIDLVSDKKTDDSISIQKDNKHLQNEETKEEKLLRKAREAREMIRLMRQKNSKPKKAEQKLENVSDNQDLLSLENPLKKPCDLGSSSNNNSEPNNNESSNLPKLKKIDSEKASNGNNVKPQTVVPQLTPKNDNCASKLSLKELSVQTMEGNNSVQSLLKHGKKDAVNVTDNPIQVCINLKMVNVCDPKPADDANRILKDLNAPFTTANKPSLNWKGFKIPKKRPRSFETGDRPPKRSKISTVREITRVIRDKRI